MNPQFFLLTLTFLAALPAFGWDQHATILVQMADSPAALTRGYLGHKVELPSPDQEKATIAKLASELQINATKVPLFSENHPKTMTVRDLIQSSIIDEPDQGMDQDLPDSADPHGDRAWMGGSTGPTSQGFRHMYFGGIVWTSPIATFQIPFHAVGQAPERYEQMKAASDRFLKEGNLFWGVRTLLWSLHYMQDLTQPFHVTQVPYYRMLPWKNLFSKFVSRSTQVIANYHYAYEGLILEYLNEAQISEFGHCFDGTDARPIDIHEVAKSTRAMAPDLGKALYALFGDQMKDPRMNLPEGRGSIDDYALLHQKEDVMPPKDEQGDLSKHEMRVLKSQMERVNALKKVRQISCELMGRVAAYTWSGLDGLSDLPPNSTSSNTGK